MNSIKYPNCALSHFLIRQIIDKLFYIWPFRSFRRLYDCFPHQTILNTIPPPWSADTPDPAGSCYVFRQKLTATSSQKERNLSSFPPALPQNSWAKKRSLDKRCSRKLSFFLQLYCFFSVCCHINAADIANVFQIWSTLAGYEELAGRINNIVQYSNNVNWGLKPT